MISVRDMIAGLECLYDPSRWICLKAPDPMASRNGDPVPELPSCLVSPERISFDPSGMTDIRRVNISVSSIDDSSAIYMPGCFGTREDIAYTCLCTVMRCICDFMRSGMSGESSSSSILMTALPVGERTYVSSPARAKRTASVLMIVVFPEPGSPVRMSVPSVKKSFPTASRCVLAYPPIPWSPHFSR